MQKKEISSTDNLLDVIRGEKKIHHEPLVEPLLRSGNASQIHNISSVSFDPRKTTVGISVSPEGIYFFAIEHFHAKQKVVGYHFLEIDMRAGIDLGGIYDALRRENIIESFQLKKTKNWFLVSSDEIEFWDVSIPTKIDAKGIPNAVYWAAKNKNKFDDSSVYFDYYFIDECTEKGIDKNRFGVYTVPKRKVQEVLGLFKKLGISLQGVTTFPLCCAQVLKSHMGIRDDGPVAVIVVEREWSRIDLYYKNALAFSRRIKTGIESFAVSIQERSRMSLVQEPDASETDLGDVSRPPDMSLEDAFEILHGYFQTREKSETDPPGQAGQEEIMEMIEPATERLIRQLERTFAHFRSTMHVPALTKLVFVGQIANFTPLVTYIGSQLDLKAETLDPFALPGLPVTSPIPASMRERAAYAPSCAAALSISSDTANLLYSFRDRLRAKTLSRVHRISTLVFIGLFSIIFLVFGWNYRAYQQQLSEYSAITKELSEYPDKITAASTMKMLDAIKKKHLYLQKYEKRFVPVSALYELTSLTPHTISIASVLNNNGDTDGKPRTFIIDGYVVGEDSMLDSYLSNYIVMLDNSLLFSDPKIQKREIEKGLDGDEIHFVVSVTAS